MEIKRQEIILQYISNGLKQNRLSPSLIFVGPKGVGKRSVALALARWNLCASPNQLFPFSCACSACKRVEKSEHPDLLILEKEEKQIGIKIESIRQLDKFLRLKPLEGRKRVALIDDADKMTNESANALLKVLEEPPVNAQIVLLAISEHNLPPTIASRCAVLRFKSLPFERKEIPADSMDLSSFELDEFIGWVNEPSWRRDGRARAEKVLTFLVEEAQRKLEKGDMAQVNRIKSFLKAREQVDRNVPPRLVLENLFLEVETRPQ